MTLKLYFHPLSSYCWKALIALYENDTAFVPHFLALETEAARAELTALWPTSKMPVLRDEARGETVPETSILIEYLDQHYPGATRFLPTDPDLARQARLWDRVFDLYVQGPVQAIVADRLRPNGAKDPFGVEKARADLAVACALVERQMAERAWAIGEVFTLADCAAAPALFYADKVAPLGDARPHTRAYLDRLQARPSFARVLTEAEPYFAMFPQ